MNEKGIFIADPTDNPLEVDGFVRSWKKRLLRRRTLRRFSEG
ncbi:MAG: hypothetical protein OEM29_07530 [Thermoplasmata archaeon]|nr:hypothetical protein [Thermoplasmata archaeon]